jgi:hypothetical protein
MRCQISDPWLLASSTPCTRRCVGSHTLAERARAEENEERGLRHCCGGGGGGRRARSVGRTRRPARRPLRAFIGDAGRQLRHGRCSSSCRRFCRLHSRCSLRCLPAPARTSPGFLSARAYSTRGRVTPARTLNRKPNDRAKGCSKSNTKQKRHRKTPTPNS